MGGPPPLRRGTAEASNALGLTEEVQRQIAPSLVAFPDIGECVTLHAQGCFIGFVEEDGVRRISITVAIRGCNCGCAAPGKAFTATPSPANARRMGERLIALADETEADAALLAAAAIKRAKGGRA